MTCAMRCLARPYIEENAAALRSDVPAQLKRVAGIYPLCGLALLGPDRVMMTMLEFIPYMVIYSVCRYSG